MRRFGFNEFGSEWGDGEGGSVIPSNVTSWVDFRSANHGDDIVGGLSPSITGMPKLTASGATFNGVYDSLIWATPSGSAFPGVSNPSGDWTFEMFGLNLAGTPGSIVGNDEAGTNPRSFHVYYRTGPSRLIVVTGATSPVQTTINSPPIGTPFHFAVERAGDTFRVYINGVVSATWTQTGPMRTERTPFYVGRRGVADYIAQSVEAMRTSNTARYNGAFTVPATPSYPGLFPASYAGEIVYRGARTWFNSPSMARDGGDIILPLVVPAVGVRLLRWTPGSTAVIAKSASTQGGDDHNEGGVLELSDGSWMWGAAGHNVASFQMLRGASPEALSEVDIDSQLGSENYSYSNLIQLDGAANDPIYLFGRGASPWRAIFSVSNDNGATWASSQAWAQDGGNRPYVQFCKTSSTRFDFILTENHPDALATSIYHGYFEAGTFYKTDGTALGPTLPINPASFTQIYNGSTNRAWVWGLQQIGGQLIATFASFPSTAAHRYHRAVLIGTTWTVETVVDDAGGYLYAAEPYYSGGLCCHPNDADTIYASVVINGFHQLCRYERGSGGTWVRAEQMTSAPTKRSFRPRVCDGYLTYLHGEYSSFTSFADVLCMGVAI